LNIKNKIKEYFISKLKPKDHIPGLVKNIHQPESLCLFFSVRSQEELGKIDKLLKNIPSTQKKLLAFVLNRAENLTDVITNKAIFCFELNDFNIFGKKNNMLQQKFTDNHCDLLISFADSKDLVSQTLVAEIDAAFKVGMKNPDNKVIFDLTIDYTIRNDYQEYFDQVMHYLSVLNITTK
jgi:hypothetical protein